MKYDKLVRDKIPEIIKQNGEQVKMHIASSEEYKQRLYEKMLEETQEFFKNPSEEELADIMEVLDAMVKLYKLSKTNAVSIQKEKALKRGRFQKRIILEETS